MATLAEILTEVEDEYDLGEETFIDEDEFIGMANSAIDVFEQNLVAEVPAYLKATPFQISLINGTQDYSLPEDIYANKMNLVYYSNGSNIYEIKPIKDLRTIMTILTGQAYQYLIVNSTSSGTKFRIYPTPAETTANVINIFYTRNIKRFETTSDTLDAPEAKLFVKEFIKEAAAKKERMTPDAPMSPNLVKILEDTIGALSMMVVDENNLVPIDTEFYDYFEGEV